MQIALFLCLGLMVCCLVPVATSRAEGIQSKDENGRDYWVYPPDKIDPDKKYTLVLGVHGYKGSGKGAGGFAGWANEHDCIVLGPSYDSSGYQYLEAGSDEQTLNLIKQMRKTYKLADKIYIAGFSGGAQMAHRFAMKYPDLVAGCASHSGGTWGTGDYDKATPNPKARSVLFVISCGENDTGKSFGSAPLGRLEWAKKYEKLLSDGGFVYDAQWWPDVGHRYSGGAKQMSVDCFIASTRILPEITLEHGTIKTALKRNDFSGAWKLIRARIDSENAKNAGIIGKLTDAYLNSLSPEITRIDRWAEQQAYAMLRSKIDNDARREALTRMQSDYAGLPKTSATIEKALSDVK